MTRFQARMLVFLAAAGFIATASNALFLQSRIERQLAALPRTELLLPQALSPSLPDATMRSPGEGLPNAIAAERGKTLTDVSPDTSKQPADVRLQIALQRELGKRGYAEQLQAGAGNGLRLAVLAYEFDHGLPLTGEAKDTLLKRVIFEAEPPPRGVFADRAELNGKLVAEVQRLLLELGFFSGTLSGRLDIWTVNAIKGFERHRQLPVTGRLTEMTLLGLVQYSGQPLSTSRG